MHTHACQFAFLHSSPIHDECKLFHSFFRQMNTLHLWSRIDAVIILNHNRITYSVFQILFEFLPRCISCFWHLKPLSPCVKKLVFFIPLLSLALLCSAFAIFVLLLQNNPFQHGHELYMVFVVRNIFLTFGIVFCIFSILRVFESSDWFRLRELENQTLAAFNMSRVSSVYRFSIYNLKKYLSDHTILQYRIYFANSACYINYAIWEIPFNSDLHVSITCEIFDLLKNRNSLDPTRHCTMIVFVNKYASDIQELLCFLHNSGFRSFIIKSNQCGDAHSRIHLLIAVKGVHDHVHIEPNYSLIPYNSEFPDVFCILFNITVCTPHLGQQTMEKFKPRQVFVGDHGESMLNCSFASSSRLL